MSLDRRVRRLAKQIQRPPQEPIVWRAGPDPVSDEELQRRVEEAKKRGDLYVIVGIELNPQVYGSRR